VNRSRLLKTRYLPVPMVATPRPRSLAKRIAFLALVVALVLGAKVLFQRPVDVDLQLDFGPTASALREVTLVFTDEHERVARDLHLLYPSGAQAVEARRLSLFPGSYRVGARLRSDGGGERRLTIPLRIEGAGRYSIGLAPTKD
jgi:hypothetical protein